MWMSSAADPANNLDGADDGTVRYDTEGIYRHIGVAVADPDA